MSEENGIKVKLADLQYKYEYALLRTIEEKHYCYECDEYNNISLMYEDEKLKIKDIEVHHNYKIPYCLKCKNKVSISKLNDIVVEIFHLKYKAINLNAKLLVGHIAENI